MSFAFRIEQSFFRAGKISRFRRNIYPLPPLRFGILGGKCEIYHKNQCKKNSPLIRIAFSKFAIMISNFHEFLTGCYTANDYRQTTDKIYIFCLTFKENNL